MGIGELSTVAGAVGTGGRAGCGSCAPGGLVGASGNASLVPTNSDGVMSCGLIVANCGVTFRATSI